MIKTVDELNEKHAVIMIGGKCQIMNEVTDPIFNRPDVTFSSMADFRNLYANRSIIIKLEGGETRTIPIAKVWIESPLRRQYAGIVFEPNGAPDGYYNLWRGFGIKPKKGNWTLFKDHLFEVICNCNTTCMEYLMCWMAHIVQKPGYDRPGTAVILRGTQGCGKGCFVNNFGAIFGCHFLHLSNQKHLTGNFNSHFKDCLLCFVDEGYWAGDKAAEGVLKGLITEDILMVEPKGKDAFPIRNHVNLIMASNNAWVVPAGLDERRFFVLDVSGDRVGDRDYFNELFRLMENGGREAMLYDLLKYNISSIDLRTIPRTKALLEQIMETLDSVQAFWLDCLSNGAIGSDEDYWPSSMAIKEIHEAYISHAEKKGVRYRDGVQQFGAKLRKICPAVEIKRLQNGSGIKRVRHYIFQSLEDCRSQFEEKIGITIPWEEE